MADNTTTTTTTNRTVKPSVKPTSSLNPPPLLTLGPSPSPSPSPSSSSSGAALAPAPAADGTLIPFSAPFPPPPRDYDGDDDDDGGVRDMDLMCPICMQLLKDAFLTACGHSFCYMCIVTHLKNKRDCPCCSRHLTPNHLFPNFLLDKLLKKASARQVSKTASPIEKFRLSLQQVSDAERQGCKVTVKELDAMISLLLEKKRRMEQEQAEKNMQVLLDFLHCLKKQKLDELNEIHHDLLYIKEDITAVERHRMELYAARERYSVKLRMLGDDPMTKSRASTVDMNSGGFSSGSRASMGGLVSGGVLRKKVGEKAQASSLGPPKKDALAGVDSEYISQSGLAMVRKKRIHAEFNDLLECYLKKRRQLDHHPRHDERNPYFIPREGYSAGLTEFQSVLSTFTRYSRLRVIAELKHGDSHPTNIVSSIEFDRDDELFATAGVSRRIKVFDYSSVVNEPGDAHVPVVEISTLSKLSCLSWNKFTKNLIASSDYEGVVAVWDVTTRQRVMEYEEHEKRAWSVDFSRTEPTMLISGSDDCKVKVWCINQESSVINIDMKANICCVKYNPGSSYHVAVGCADHQIQYFDLRNVSRPLHVFSGHTKAVSYVKFLSATELASASTDSTLRLWDVNKNTPVRTFKGHTNEKNFVGLSTNSNFISCGSETNEVFVYHKEISKPTAWHKFGAPETERADEEAGYFISAVCWKNDSPTLISANSQGSVKVMVLAA